MNVNWDFHLNRTINSAGIFAGISAANYFTISRTPSTALLPRRMDSNHQSTAWPAFSTDQFGQGAALSLES